MATKISTAARNAAADAVVDLIDGGSGAGTLKIYTGTPPTNVSDSPTGTLLGTLTFSDPAFGSASSGIATASAITSDTSADASGTAGYFRALDSNGVVIFQGSAGGPTDGANLTLNSATITAGGTIACTAMTYTQPVAGT